MRRFLFLFLLSISGIPIFVNIKKYKKKLKNGPCHRKTGQKKKKKKKMKNTKIKIKCVGGDLLYLLCLISNTMPQLEQSSLQPSTDLQHRHLLQTTSYNHLRLLHLLISRKGKPKQQQARKPPPPPPTSRGLRSQKGLRPFNPLQRIRLFSVLFYHSFYYPLNNITTVLSLDLFSLYTSL